MKKEMLLTVVMGLIIGLIITFGIYRARSAQTPEDAGVLSTSPSPTPNASADSTGMLVLHSPEDEQIVDSETVTVAGTTRPNIFVVIFVNGEETITTADSSGNFSVQRDLETGSNVIIVQAIAEDGTVTKIERTVIYSTVDFELESPEATAEAEASPAP